MGDKKEAIQVNFVSHGKIVETRFLPTVFLLGYLMIGLHKEWTIYQREFDEYSQSDANGKRTFNPMQRDGWKILHEYSLNIDVGMHNERFFDILYLYGTAQYHYLSQRGVADDMGELYLMNVQGPCASVREWQDTVGDNFASVFSTDRLSITDNLQLVAQAMRIRHTYLVDFIASYVGACLNSASSVEDCAKMLGVPALTFEQEMVIQDALIQVSRKDVIPPTEAIIKQYERVPVESIQDPTIKKWMEIHHKLPSDVKWWDFNPGILPELRRMASYDRQNPTG